MDLSGKVPLKLSEILQHSWKFLKSLWSRVSHDRLTVTAGYLAYVSLLSLVPLLSVSLAVLSAFPAFREVIEILEQYAFSNFMPHTGEAFQTHLQEFIDNAGRMSAVGLLGLVVVALLLISAIDQNLNYIFRCHKQRRWTVSFPMYWMILTLGPMLAAGSVAVSSYLMSLRMFSGEDFDISFIKELVLSYLPMVLTTIAYLALYLVVPNRKVLARYAIWGALLAGLLFESSKGLFALYITQFPTYQAIYGALAAIPILFVWIYLAWIIVLLGAEVTAALEEYFEEQHELVSQAQTTKKLEEAQGDRTNSTGK